LLFIIYQTTILLVNKDLQSSDFASKVTYVKRQNNVATFSFVFL